MIFIQLADEVMLQRERDGVRGLDRERSRYRCHIVNAPFAHLEVEGIRTKQIREWLRAMGEKQTAGSGPARRLSRHTVNRTQSLVSAIFSEAVDRELIEQNPCIGAKVKRRVDTTDTVEKWAILTPEEQAQIAACAEIPTSDRLAVAFAIATGLRQGEQHHLELADVVVDGPEPHVVVRYASLDRAGQPLPPKSGKLRRIPLFGDGLAATRAWLALLPMWCADNPKGLMWPTQAGRYRSQGKPLGKSGTFKEYLALAGIKRRVRWHDLRHTCASNLIAGHCGRRWTMEEVQIIMGHSSITITQRYAHLGDDALKRAARETEEATATPHAVESGPTLMERGARWLADMLRRAS